MASQKKLRDSKGIKGTLYRLNELRTRTAFAAERIADFLRLRSRSEEHTSELQSQSNLVCRLLLEKKKTDTYVHARGLHYFVHRTVPLADLPHTTLNSGHVVPPRPQPTTRARTADLDLPLHDIACF